MIATFVSNACAIIIHMGWADRTGGELYHCWYRAPKAGTALVQIHDREKALLSMNLKPSANKA
jgi:hypothetical protein